jgi:antitoxin component of MazEF toxin-antitoxin module
MNMKAEKVALGKTEPKLTLEQLLASVRPDNLHGEQDWGSPVGKEEW